MKQSETFYGKIRDSGNGSHEITIPKNVMEFAGLETGDELKILIQKKE